MPSSHQTAGLGVRDRTANETGWTALLGADGIAEPRPFLRMDLQGYDLEVFSGAGDLIGALDVVSSGPTV